MRCSCFPWVVVMDLLANQPRDYGYPINKAFSGQFVYRRGKMYDVKMILDERRALSERIKELNCMYDISRLFSQRSLRLKGLLKEIVRIIPNGWQFPERTCAKISYGGREYRSMN